MKSLASCSVSKTIALSLVILLSYFILAPIYLLIILNFTVYSLQISVLSSLLLSLFTSTMITLPLYPSEIKSTRGQFKIE